VLPVAELFNGGIRVVRDRSYDQLAITGEPPADELGYGFCVLVALLGRPQRVVLIDLEREDVASQRFLRYLLGSLPLALAQLTASAVAVAVQSSALRPLRAEPRRGKLRPSLEKLVYLRPTVGSASRVGGSVTHSNEVIRALRAEGVGVAAFTTDRKVAATVESDPDSPSRWRVVRAPRVMKAIAASAAAGGDVALARSAVRAARAADAIYQRHARFSVAGSLLAHLSGRPLILEYNGSEAFKTEHWTSTRFLKGQVAACQDAALNTAALIVVVSEVDRRSLLERGVSSDRILLNPNGVDPEHFAVGGGSSVRERHGIPDERVVVGFVGTFGSWHGAPMLARGFAEAATTVSHAHLLLVGDGQELEPSLRILRTAGLEARTTVVGEVPPTDIPSYLDACDLLVAPHVPLPNGVEFFGSPTKLFEYMAAGKAIIASRLGQIGDVLEHGVTAWMVEPGDSDELGEAIVALASKPELRRELGEKARRQAIERHSWRLNARRVIHAYAELAARAS
jgi:glycosyltransferase involved in cell wall biosynthesis